MVVDLGSPPSLDRWRDRYAVIHCLWSWSWSLSKIVRKS